ncbi:MAG: cell division protein FtsZ [Sphaerochaeta sp.]|jgi:cell division protein FtsZ|uniref:cell division protein FtsZ n=1 Tax=Sphaerochaeta sp. TaxID=1972642 RepID=UPI000E87371D|nr:cell division protein FtsZ [uncultured Sphaerochaeta sp.]MEA4865393.1 cell division protein FtsZ [Sphaerochaeta sp.]HAP57262.1 cell division protein FtsZ [Sphaerochaeta sp.]HBO36304.1 cell division protein FtsZ [Sphaerochaeta sp.]HCU30710.1 cell division protein FtsZ [Sphaerochaeta sp.]
MDFGMFEVEDMVQDEQATSTIIKVVGVGGAGGNAVNRMIASGLKKVHFVTMNTDMQALQRSNAQIRIPIGKELTGGLGAGGVPEVGEKAAQESKEDIRREIENADMVFITAGMGGGTGTGAAPIVAEIAKSCNALTVAVVTTPFAFEGKKKLMLAQAGIEKLRKQVDTLIIIPNQYLLKVVENNTPIKQAFLMADEVLYMGVQGISELITEPGEINIDFADVRTVMKGKGDALMGIGFGEGANRAVDAARQAISNPLLENASIEGAKSVLVNLAGSDNLTLQEYQDVVELVTERCADDALIIAGQAFNPELGDRIKVTVVATGFERKEDVVGAELADIDMVKRRYATAKREDGKSEESSQPAKKSEEQSEVASIQVNRWQDLQKQLGKGPNTNANDYTIPAVLRYSRNKADDN